MTKLYTVKRENISVGKVITEFKINKNKESIQWHGTDFTSFYGCRSMLFTKNYDGTTEDLLYCSPSYKIYNGTNAEECEKEKFIIAKEHNIGLLLKMLGYEEELDYYDVEGIRKRLFDGKFPINNLEKFGLTEMDPKFQKYYDEKGKEIVDADILKKLIRQRKIKQFFGQEADYCNTDIYDGLSSEVLQNILIPQEYFYILKELGNHSLSDVIRGYEERIDAFKPAKEEGMIRSLKKYD